MSLSRNGVNERVWGYLVSGNYFDMLGVRALKGRMFTQDEDRVPGANPVAVVSYGCWQRRFGADPNLVGKTIKLNAHDFTIVGVGPEEFRGTALIFEPEIYAPMMMAKQIAPGESNWLENRGDGGILGLGRLKQGVTTPQARESLNLLLAQFAREYKYLESMTFSVTPPGLVFPLVRNGTLGFAGVLMATVGLVLLIACVNLANLLLARAARRRKEIAIRLSLGAGRMRGDVMMLVVRQGMWLALVGLAIGLAGALVLTRLMSSVLYGVSATDVPRFAGVTLLLGLVVFIACYLPARRAAKVDPMVALRFE